MAPVDTPWYIHSDVANQIGAPHLRMADVDNAQYIHNDYMYVANQMGAPHLRMATVDSPQHIHSDVANYIGAPHLRMAPVDVAQDIRRVYTYIYIMLLNIQEPPTRGWRLQMLLRIYTVIMWIYICCYLDRSPSPENGACTQVFVQFICNKYSFYCLGRRPSPEANSTQ